MNQGKAEEYKHFVMVAVAVFARNRFLRLLND